MLGYDDNGKELNIGDWITFHDLFIEPEEDIIPKFGKVRDFYWDDFYESEILIIDDAGGNTISFRNIQDVDKVTYEEVVKGMLEL